MKEDKNKMSTTKKVVIATGALIIGGKVYGTLKKKNATKSNDLNSWWKK